MKKHIALFMILALTLVSAFALAEMDITGVWYADLGSATAELTLNADGTYRLAALTADEQTGAWELRDGFLYLDGADDPALATWGEGTLILSSGEGFFTREQPWAYAPADALADGVTAELFKGYWKSAFVDAEGVTLPAGELNDVTDVYVDSSASPQKDRVKAALDGPLFGDVIVDMAFENGALVWSEDGVSVTLQLQQDSLMRMTLSAPDGDMTLYLLRQYVEGVSPEPAEE